MNGMKRELKLYTGTIIIIGLSILLFGLYKFRIPSNLIPEIVFFIVLAIISESFRIDSDSEIYLSVIFAIGFASVIVFNPIAAALVTFLGFLCDFEYSKENGFKLFSTDIYKNLFNATAYVLCALTSGLVYRAFSTVFSYEYGKINIMGTLLAIITYIAVNILIYTLLMAILEERSIKELLISNIWLIRNFLAISPLGVFLALAYLNFGKFVVILFFVPLLLARYSFKLYMDMRHVYFETIKALSSAMEAKDQYTNGHSYRVADYAVGIAKQMGFDRERIDRIKTAAILHDIGKIGVTDSILNKPGQLIEEEYMVIQRHPEIGAKILSEVDFLGDVANIIKYHHERYDGKGYPEGLSGPAIPIEACILSVADAYDAMTSDRPYRKAMTSQMAQNILIKESGTQFHPIVAKAFQDHISTWEGKISNVG
ncbi:MAG: HD-GYP domain-containing protein [Bacillota bacterium]